MDAERQDGILSRYQGQAGDDPNFHLHTWTPVLFGNTLAEAGFLPRLVAASAPAESCQQSAVIDPQHGVKNLTEPVLPVVQISVSLQPSSTFFSHFRFSGLWQ